MNGAIIAFDPCHACESHDMCSRCELTLRRDGALRTDKWISVEEKLPETSDDYLVYLKYSPLTYIVTKRSYSKERGWYGVQNGHYYTEVDVTHWMPLPEPPKMKGGAE